MQLIEIIKYIEFLGDYNSLEIANCLAYCVWQRHKYHLDLGYVEPSEDLVEIVGNSPLFKPAEYGFQTRLVLRLTKSRFEFKPTEIFYDDTVDWTQFMAAFSAYYVQHNHKDKSGVFVELGKRYNWLAKAVKGMDVAGIFDGLDRNLWQAFQYTLLGNAYARECKDQTPEYRGNILGLRLLEKYGEQVAEIPLSQLLEEAVAMIPDVKGDAYKEDKFYRRLADNMRV